MSDQKSNWKKLTGLWKNEGRNGKYLSAKVKEEITIPAGYTVAVFQVRDKKGNEKAPDYDLLIAPPRE